MLEVIQIGKLIITVEGTWYEVSNGVEVIEYGNVEAGTTPTKVYELLKAKGAFTAIVSGDALKTNTYVYLPNKDGHYHSVRVPQYVKNILVNVKHLYDYTYKLTGVNPQRTGYGINEDLAKLESWVKRFHSDFTVKKINGHDSKIFFIPTSAIFEMTDPVAHQLENARLI